MYRVKKEKQKHSLKISPYAEETPLTSRQEHKTLVKRQINVTTISKLEKLADKFLLLEALR